MSGELKSPTCADCAKARGLMVPGSVHTVSMGRCANCDRDKPVSPASDWRRPGERIHPEEWD